MATTEMTTRKPAAPKARRVRGRDATAPSPLDLRTAVVEAWITNNRATTFLVERIPEALWDEPASLGQKRTVRTIAAHLHNSRRRWINVLGAEFGIEGPERVDEKSVTRRQLVSALNRSSRGMVRLLELGADHGGRIPPSAAYTWRNLPLDVGHVLSYFAAHEGHHRGQIVMLARQLGHRLPVEITGGVWQFSRFLAERR